MLKPDEIPLLAALMKAAEGDRAAFFAPGHKQGQGSPAALVALLGRSALRADLPELPELDNLFAPAGPILAAQHLAAQTFGAEATYFLANGSTCGIEAALLAVCAPGEKVLVPRNAHRSVLSALVLSGAQPIFLTPIADARWDLAFGTTPEQVATAFRQYPDLRAAVVVSPSYHGVCVDVAAIAAIVHAHDAVLVVDEAHGAHLGFHEALPAGAIAGGADVVIQSTHKVLSAVTQASMLHVQGQRVDRDRLQQALQITQSTSPNYWLLASLDAARYQMATEGTVLMAQTLAIAEQVRSRLAPLASLTCLTANTLAAASPHFSLDPTRLTVDVSALGLTGLTADEWLHTRLGVTAELPTLRQLAFILSLGNTMAEGDRLIAAFESLIEHATDLAHPLPQMSSSVPTAMLTAPPISPRDAFFAPNRTVAIADAIGHIAADALCPYPPGIPVWLPGEPITAAAIATVQHLHAAGSVITGGSDPTFKTLRIIETD